METVWIVVGLVVAAFVLIVVDRAPGSDSTAARWAERR